jgi:hypothetical protein
MRFIIRVNITNIKKDINKLKYNDIKQNLYDSNQYLIVFSI